MHLMFLPGSFLHISYQDTLIWSILNVIVTPHYRRPSMQISHKLVVLRYIVDGFGSFWLVLLVVGGQVLANFGWFHVLV